MGRSSSESKTQIDRLGDRLRKGEVTAETLTQLDSYRRSFTDSYEDVIHVVRAEVGLEPTGRPAKSTTSIIEKLRRESIRLSQIEDIAGCRVVVPNLRSQDGATRHLRRLFAKSTIVDRRLKPSHGYRAVHVIATAQSKPVEIQIRTALQHLWAELSEKLSDVYDPAIKYGGGDAELVSGLTEVAEVITAFEKLEGTEAGAEFQARKREGQARLEALIAELAKRKGN